MRKALLVVGILTACCSPGFAGPNSNGALIVHTNDLYYPWSSGNVCTTTLGQPATCEGAIVQSDKDFITAGRRSTVWFLAAFLPGSSPRVAAIYFGTDVDDWNLDVGSNYAPCTPAGSTTQVPDDGWPYDMGNSVGFGTPVLGNTLFRVYVFGIDNYDDDPTAPNPWWCSAINPTGGYAAFFDDMFPPNEDRITQFGCVKWYEPGYNQCPEMIPISGACCFATGECLLYTSAECVTLGGSYVGDDTTCVPESPCAQPGACCDLETGACSFVLEADCLAPLVWHGEWTCAPNFCPPPVPTEGTTWGQIKSSYR